MPSNFEYLITQKEYALFANACTEAERGFSSSPAMCAVGCRKALELAVKWVYAADAPPAGRGQLSGLASRAD